MTRRSNGEIVFFDWRGGEEANAAVCKTVIRGFESLPRLHSDVQRRQPYSSIHPNDDSLLPNGLYSSPT